MVSLCYILDLQITILDFVIASVINRSVIVSIFQFFDC